MRRDRFWQFTDDSGLAASDAQCAPNVLARYSEEDATDIKVCKAEARETLPDDQRAGVSLRAGAEKIPLVVATALWPRQ